jgi:hypothetical protein
MNEKFLLNGLSLMGEEDVVGIKVRLILTHFLFTFFCPELRNKSKKSDIQLSLNRNLQT